ncbi:unnamed protein product [Haemonchus placei]|uniref:Phage_base_V domain-containing protein n=1 Tax=Haemonchus placei TaxID=6290 RepID=A0A0N4X3C3_HAEPC|nr:unnamed protein product [Haemonchus placei]
MERQNLKFGRLCLINRDREKTLQSNLIWLECCKNGKTYKEGEEFTIGHLRYKCQKYGVYSIEGCVTEAKKNLKIGQTTVENNVKAQCLGKGNSVFYRETVCGTMGQPDCDKIDLPSGYKEAVAREESKPKITLPGLPPGWSVIDETHQDIPGSGGHSVVSRTLMFQARRQTGHGVGSVVGIEDVGTDKPPMPLSMQLNGGKVILLSSEMIGKVGLYVWDMKYDFQPETVVGSRSHVNWSGRKVVVNGKTVGVGEGTFTFGNSPTGAAAKKGH